DFSTSAWVALALGAGNGKGLVVAGLHHYLSGQYDAVARDQTGSFSKVNAVALYALAYHAIDAGDFYDEDEPDLPLMRLARWAPNESLAVNEQMYVLGTLSHTGHPHDADGIAQ